MTDESNSIEPVPVRIVGAEEEKSAIFGTWVKHALTGTEPSRQILPQDGKRKRAVIVVTGAPGVVYIGSPAQTQSVAVAARSAGELSGGSVVTSESATEQWIVPDGTNPMTVSVLTERYL